MLKQFRIFFIFFYIIFNLIKFMNLISCICDLCSKQLHSCVIRRKHHFLISLQWEESDYITNWVNVFGVGGEGGTERIDDCAGNCKRVMRNTLFCFLLPFLSAFQLNHSTPWTLIVCPPPPLKMSEAKFDLCLYYFVQWCRKLSASAHAAPLCGTLDIFSI